MRLLLGTFCFVILLSACTKFDSLELTDVDVEIIPSEGFNEAGLDIEEDADDVPALLLYTLEFKNNNFTSIGQSNIEAYIEPGSKLKKAMEETFGRNIYEQPTIISGTSLPGIPGREKADWQMCYGLGVEDAENTGHPELPSDEEMIEIDDNALDATLIIREKEGDKKELARFNLHPE